jgi:hypothetical protein
VSMADETETEARYAPEWWERTSGVAVDSKAAEGLADFQQMRRARCA